MRIRNLLPAILLASNIAAAASAPGEVGLPFVTWISPQEYAGAVQVFSLAQDDRGLLYAGLTNGMREYDGTSWRSIATPHGAVIRSLALGPGGRIFIGEVGDFGYLEPDASGARHYRSLLEFVPKEHREFQDVRKVLPTPEGVYFQSYERLFLLTPDGNGWRTKVWIPQTLFRNAFYLSGTLYVCVAGVGLARMNGGQLESVPAPGLETSLETSLSFMLPYSTSGHQILLGSRDGGLFLFDDRGLHPFPVDAAAILKSQRIAAGAQLQDGAYAIGTRNGGLVLLEKSGRTRRYLDRSANVLADGVLSLFVDSNGTLWAGLQNGVCKIEVSAALTEFGATSGMSASVNDPLSRQALRRHHEWPQTP